MGLIIRKIDRKTVQGKWYERVLFGCTVRFKIRPKTNAVTKEIRDEHKRLENGMEVYDEPAIFDALQDYLLESFEGFDEEPGKPREVNLDNKKAVLMMDVPVGEISNWTFVMEKAVQDGIEIYKDVLKN